MSNLGTNVRRWGESGVVLLMALVMAALAAVAGRHLLGAAVHRRALLPWWALAIGFAAAETWVVHLQVKRESRDVSMSELPLVLGLFFASPLQLLIGRLAGSAAVILLHRRASPLKTFWNLGLLSLQTAVTVSLFRLISGGRGESSVLTWAGAYAGPLAANVIGVVAIALVVALHEGDLRPRQVLKDMLVGDPAAPALVTIGLVAVSSLGYSSRNAWLLLLLAVGVLAGYRAYAALANRHLGLERL